MRMLMLMLMRLRVLWLAVLFAAVSLATRIIDVTAAPLHRRLLDLVGLASLTLAGVALLAAILEQRQGDRAAAESGAVRRLARLEQIMAIPFATESLDDLLPEMAVRLRQALESDFAAVLLVEDGALAVKVSSGADEAADVGTVVPPGAGLVGRVLQDGNTRAWGSLDPDKVALPSLAGGLGSAAAAALVAGGAVIGVVAVGSKARSRYDDARLAVLDFAAERLAGAVQRAQLRESERRASLGAEHARRHLRLLGDASRVLMQSVDDYERPLTEIVARAVGTFASLAAVFLAEGEQDPDLRLLVAHGTGDDEQLALPRSALHAVTGAMAAGQSRLVIWSDPKDVDESARPLARALHRRGMHSYIVAPIQVRGLSFGALLFATGEGVRGYRPSDRHAADELAQRVALAAEATLLYREARANAAVTASHLMRLRSLLDIWLDVVAARDPSSILQQAARGAARLLTPATVVIVSDGEHLAVPPTPRKSILSDRVLAVFDRQPGLVSDRDPVADVIPPADRESLGSHWLAAPIVLADGNRRLIVVSSNDGSFGPEDESLLVLLCQMVATTLDNIGLYRDSHTAAARLGALFQASPAPIVTLGPDLTPSTWNPAAAALFGWSSDAGAGTTLPDSITACVGELAARAEGDRGPRQRECELEQDGTTRSLVLMLAEIHGEHVGDREHILVVSDETEGRSLARQIQRAQRLEAVGRLAGGVAHDFNNLLTVILGYADGLLRRMDEHEPNRERVEAIYRAGNRGADLTRQLLTVSRQQVANPVVLEPAAVVDEMSTMMRQLVGEDIAVLRRPGGEQLTVRIDRPQLEQILLNLASNARDAMGDGGRLEIAVTEVDAAAVWPEGTRGEGWVAVTATDTGSGMDPQTLVRCLEPLFTTKTDRGGTGLGLATAYGIAAQHGGDLRVESKLGRGTTVTLLLPAVDEPVSRSDDATFPSPLAPATVGEGTILLVDDDADVRTMADRTLRERGFHVITATSAHEALVAAAESPGQIDILVTDVAMPGMSGAELAGLLQLSRPTPVLFISGYAERLGADAVLGDFLAKPFTPDQLIDAVAAVLAAAPAGSDQGSKR